eukprot:Hpha_TRINITY_DN7750_c0_g2::TRINITY_DN7750_c0_g2_i1::g.85327::m.85327
MNEAGIPPGTYQRSCRGCRLAKGGTTVWCSHCPKTCGTKVQTEEVLVSKCGAFGNNDGVLVCDRPANAEDTPSGSYKQTCGGCELDGTVLSCTHCDGEGGRPTMSVLDTARRCRDIVNVRGTLECIESDHSEL